MRVGWLVRIVRAEHSGKVGVHHGDPDCPHHLAGSAAQFVADPAQEDRRIRVVGAVGLVVDLTIYNLLLHDERLDQGQDRVDRSLATIVTYFGNRYWSFSHRAPHQRARETSFCNT